jgi:dTDP-4-dehydrorhamnose reductase
MMPSPTILITGAAGFLGWNLARTLSAAGHHVVACHHETPPDDSLHVDWHRFDMENARETARLAGLPFGVLINCAAIADRARCETEPARARRINVDAAGRLAAIAGERGAMFLHISTDLVFDGSRGWYTEDDPVSPCSLYAESKALSEQAVRASCPDAFVIRTALMCGIRGSAPGGFLGWTLRGVRRDAGVHLYRNQYRTVLYAPDVARIAVALLAERPAPGIYHAAGPDRRSRWEIGVTAAEIFFGSSHGIHASALLRNDGTDAFDDASLRTEKIRGALGLTFTPLVAALEACRRDVASGLRTDIPPGTSNGP